MSPAFPKLTKQDADLCRALQAIVKKGKFEFQGEALAKAGAIFRWFQDLDKRIEASIEPPADTIRKEVGTAEPEKKAE